MNFELMALRGALGVYALAGSLAIAGVVLRRSPQPWVFGLAVLGLAMHGVSLGVRWAQLGHGPFITMYEILSSNVWSLLAIFVLACWRYVALRPAAAIVLPLLFVMMAWLALQNPRAGHLPPTYDTAWLYIHVGFGKAFLGAVLIAVGLGGIVLARLTRHGAIWFDTLPADRELDELAYQFLALGLIFETLMLVAAIWAQAHGDGIGLGSLETWAFYLAPVGVRAARSIHAQANPAGRRRLAIGGVFVLAFLFLWCAVRDYGAAPGTISDGPGERGAPCSTARAPRRRNSCRGRAFLRSWRCRAAMVRPGQERVCRWQRRADRRARKSRRPCPRPTTRGIRPEVRPGGDHAARAAVRARRHGVASPA